MEQTVRCGQAHSSHPFAMLSLLILIMAAGCGDDFEHVHGNASNESFTAPLLISPVDGEEIDWNNPTLSWYAVPNALTYRVEISDRDDFTTIEEEVEDTPATSYMISDFPINEGRHFWRVRARDAYHDWSPWSVPTSFTVVNNNTAISKGNAGLITYPPGDITIFVQGRVEFKAHVPGESGRHQCVWDFGGLGSCRGKAEPEPVVFESPGSYVIRFMARDQDGATLTDEVRVSVVDESPDLIAPVDGYSTEEDSIDFSWGPVPGASSYILFIPFNGAASERSITARGTSLRETGFEPGNYLWWVYAKDSLGNLSACQEPRIFTIRGPSRDEEPEVFIPMLFTLPWDARDVKGARGLLNSLTVITP
jgi:hypothetical protein